MGPKLNKSKHEPQSAVCYEYLVSKMQRGELVSGMSVTEQGVADELGISRTPAREALRRLEIDGLVVSEPRFGMKVTELGYIETLELYEAREALEMAAVEICAEKISDIEIAELEILQKQMAGSVRDPSRMASLNYAFHKALLNAVKNRYLTMSFEVIQKTLAILGPTTLANTERAEESLIEHQELIQCLKHHDSEGARKVMGRHLSNAKRIRLRQINQRLVDES
ncbi:GntR family transcriptional regulator [Litoricolaceae bacterium]|nr:GntR family transcriptional regulator [Litorivicinaceae bacterium]